MWIWQTTYVKPEFILWQMHVSHICKSKINPIDTASIKINLVLTSSTKYWMINLGFSLPIRFTQGNVQNMKAEES